MSRAGQGVTVKALEWAAAIHGGECALGAAGVYHVFNVKIEGVTMYEVSNPFNHDNPKFPSVEEAKAAAQADYDARIKSAIVGAPAVAEVTDGWLPIDTAPKDGSFVDLWHRGQGRVADCRWFTNRSGFTAWHAQSGGHAFNMGVGMFTHWRPLPSPPALEAAIVGGAA